jgi:hypothetical protein
MPYLESYRTANANSMDIYHVLPQGWAQWRQIATAAGALRLPLYELTTPTFSVCRHAESSLDVLMQHSNRWRKVEFHIPFSLLPKLNAVKGQISSLEALALDLEYHRGFNGFIVDCFESAPALKTLKLPSNLWDILVPWTQIIDFTADRASMFIGFQKAALCSHLTSLTLAECRNTFEDMYNFSTLRFLCSLKVLTSRGSKQTSILDVFSYITMPRLASLKVHASHPDHGLIWNIPHFLGMVNRSQPFALRSLDLRNTRMGGNTLILCLEVLPSLETLIVAVLQTLNGVHRRGRDLYRC